MTPRARWLALGAVLGALALLCGGLDHAARERSRDAREQARSRAAAPVRPASEGAKQPGDPQPSAPAAPTPARPPPREESAVAATLGLASTLVQLYGDCRDGATWVLKLQRRRAAEKLERPGLDDEERAALEGEIRMLDGLLDDGTVIVCGALGPSEPPDWVLGPP